MSNDKKIVEYNYEEAVSIEDACVICFSGDCNAQYNKHPNALFHRECLMRCNSCPLCRGKHKIDEINEMELNIKNIPIQLPALYKELNRSAISEYMDIDNRKAIAVWNNINKYKVIVSKNIIKIHASKNIEDKQPASRGMTRSINSNAVCVTNGFDKTKGYIPIMYPIYYRFSVATIIIASIDEIVNDEDIFIRGVNYVDDDITMNYVSPKNILLDMKFSLVLKRVWIRLIFTDANGLDKNSYIAFSVNEDCPGIIAKIVHPLYPNRQAVFQADFPRPYWKHQKLNPIDNTLRDNYVKFLQN